MLVGLMYALWPGFLPGWFVVPIEEGEESESSPYQLEKEIYVA